MSRLSLPMLVAACAFAGGAAAQTPRATAPPADPAQTPVSSVGSLPAVRVQYDQVREFLDHGTPIPPPDAFEREYEKVKAAVPPPPPSLAASRAMAQEQMKQISALLARQRFADMARGEASSLLGGLISQIPNPVANMLVNRAVSSVEANAENRIRQKEQQQIQLREQQLNNAYAHKIVMQTLRAAPGLQRISIWGSWVRIDNPRDHSAVVYKPDLGRYLVIDKAYDLYRIIKGPPPINEPPAFACTATGATSPLGAGTLAGLPVHGYRATRSRSIHGMTMTHTQTFYTWDQALPQQVLDVATGNAACPANSPVGSRYPRDRLVLYVATRSSATAATDGSSRDSLMPPDSLNQLLPESVEWRGHLRMLTDADRALFEPPAGYRQVQ